jgi:hypothetical protein
MMSSTPSATQGILDRPLPQGRKKVSLSAFSFLFAAMVQLVHSRVPRNAKASDLERKLSEMGVGVGVRVNELVALRETPGRRVGGKTRTERIVAVLQFVHTTVWRSLFGRPADALEKGADSDHSYMITDDNPITNRFCTGRVNCGAYLAGVVQGILLGEGFPAEVTAHAAETDERPGRTTFLIEFDEER